MATPMEGSVNVNSVQPVHEPYDEPFGEKYDKPYDEPYGETHEAQEEFSGSAPPLAPAAGDLGPCLYLGPAGQRCSRRAVEGSFCARHQPDSSGQFPGLSVPQISRRTVAILGLLAVLWPVLADLVRELIRLLR
jgi:hypothetical protein